jgi:hypothetical protein
MTHFIIILAVGRNLYHATFTASPYFALVISLWTYKCSGKCRGLLLRVPLPGAFTSPSIAARVICEIHALEHAKSKSQINTNSASLNLDFYTEATWGLCLKCHWILYAYSPFLPIFPSRFNGPCRASMVFMTHLSRGSI